MTLQFYFARRFAVTFGFVTLIFAGLIWMTDTVEQIRRFAETDITFGMAARLAALKSPGTLYQILPLLTIIATVSMFLRLARGSELVVTRAAGRSGLRALGAPLVVVAVIGVFAVTVLNPMVAATGTRFEQIEARLSAANNSVLSINDEGLWLRQASGTGQVVIHARSSNDNGTVLGDVMFLGYADGALPTTRIEAETARLTPGAWQLTNAKRWWFSGDAPPEEGAQVAARMSVPTDLTLDRIRDSFGPPQSVPFWDLPGFIDRLERAGFAARAHRVWFHMELASPLNMMAMVLIGAGFTMRHTRFGKTGLMVLLAILLGFGMFFLRTLAQVLGDLGEIPAVLAAWIPPVAAALLSIGLLLHTEDG